MSKRCYCRYDNGIFLWTCFKPKGHEGIHRDDSAKDSPEWTTEQGWWDQHGDSPERARKVTEPDTEE